MPVNALRRRSRFLFRVTTELEAHGGKNFGSELPFGARSEALVEGFAEHGGGRSGLDGGENGPAAFAGVGDAAGEALEGRLLEKRDGGEIEEPGSDDAAAAPDFGNVGEIEIVLVVFGISQRGGLGVCFVVLLSDIGVLENVQAFGVGGHETVLDAVVDHFYEMAGAGRSAVEVALFGCAAGFFTPRRARRVAAAGRERFENGIQMVDNVVFAADHLAIAALEAPDAAAGADVDVVNAAGGKFLGAANVVDVVGVATVDEDVAGFEFGGEVMESCIDDAGGDHEPDGAGLGEFLYEIVEGGGADGAFAGELLNGVGTAVVDDALVFVFLETAHHVGAHPA